MNDRQGNATAAAARDHAPALDELRIHAIGSIGQVTPADWDACANPRLVPSIGARGVEGTGDGDFEREFDYNPFISHAFLAALEESGSVGGRSGWQAQHLLVKATDGSLLAAAPCYVKSHSRGEYVFDRGWADAYERAGGRYYPKLQVSVPFTPATGPRLLIRDGENREQIASALASGLLALTGVSKASSAHVTFAPEEEWKFLAKHGFLQRTDQQFHWRNQGFVTF